jgi:[protein-PII] uridylyltransferase
MLLLLTYADAQAVGPGVWTEWKDYCLWELYHRAYDRLMLTKSAAVNQEIEKTYREIMNVIGTEMTEKQVNHHLKQLPNNYVLYTPVSQIVEQLRLVSKLQHSEVVLEWLDHPDQGYCDLILVTRDHPGLFAEIAGGLSAFNLNILSAQLNTRGDGLVCDVFQVGSLAGTHKLHREDYPRVGRLLNKVITGQANIEDYLKTHTRPSMKATSMHAVFPPRIRIDNSVSPFATVIEIQAEDRLGLGYQIAKTLSGAKLNIVFAKLSTEKSYAFDVFYVCDKRRNKIVEAQRLKQLEEQLRADILNLA